MCGEFGEVMVIIGLVINFLALGTLFLNSRDTLSYILKGSFTIFLFSVRTHILDSNEVWYS